MADPVTLLVNVAVAVGTTAIANALAPTQKFEGPRLDDLRVQTSTLGKFRPIPFGTVAYAGNVLWLENNELKETRHKESSGGKGGPKVENTTYTYSATFAVGFGRGPVGGVLRIWADSVLIYDAASTDPAAVYEGGQLYSNITFYPGSETQEVNPRIEAEDSNASAFRGECNIVFEDFQLAKFGNRIPNITAELIGGSVSLAPVSLQEHALRGTARQYGASALYFDEAAGELVLFLNRGALYAADPLDVFRVQLNGEMVRLRSFHPANYGTHLDGWSDQPVVVTSDSAGEITINNQYGFVSGRCDGCGTGLGEERSQFYQRSGYRWLLREDGSTTYVYNVNGSDAALIYESNGSTPTGQLHTMFPGENVIFAYSHSANLICFDYSWNVLWSVDMSAESITISSAIGPNDAILRATTDDRVLLYHKRNFWMIDESGYTHLGASEPPGWTVSYEEHGGHHFFGQLFCYYKAQQHKYELIDIASGAAAQTASLGSVVTSVSESAGLSASDIDVTGLSGIDVDGYVVSRLGSGKSALEPLQLGYLFDAIESGYKIKFVPRGGSSVATIPDSDLAAYEYGQERPQPLPVRVIRESLLPQKTKVGYVSAARDYEPDMQESERVVTDSETTNQIDLSLVLSDDYAAQLAEIYQNVAWIERSKYEKFTLPYKYSYLEPSDIVDITYNGATHSVRIEEINIGRPGIVECTGVAQKAAHYTSNAVGIPGQASTQTVSVSGSTNLVLLDIPLLRDQDDDSGFYIAAGGYYSGWPGCIVMKSTDGGQTYTQMQAIVNESIIGYLTATPTTGDITVIDTENTINVKLFNGGQLSSVSQLAMFSGSNAAAIGADGRWVIIKFQNATLEGDGSYTLSNIMWGYQGSEINLSSLSAEDTFVMLTDAMIRAPANDNEIGLERHYKAVTLGKNESSAQEVAFTNNAISLTPYAPVHILGSRDGSANLTIDFTRRTRIGGEWRDLVNASLGEDSESYEIDVMNGSTVVRTIAVTSPTASYTAAQQTTDFGSTQSSVEVNIYQLSATVGRGYAGNATI